MQSISSMPVGNDPRMKEVAILSMSHMSGLTNQSIDELASMIEMYVGAATINVDPSIQMNETKVKDYTLSGHQLVIILAPDSGEAMNDVFQYAYDTYPYFWSNEIHYRPWHDEKQLGLPYYTKVNQAILDRPTMPSKLFVLQYHLTSVYWYSNTIDWNKEYDGISDSFILSQKDILLANNANVIESNSLTEFSIHFPIQLNFVNETIQ